MLEAIFQASLSIFLKEIEPGTWIPLGVFAMAWHKSHRSKIILDLIYGYSKQLEKASYSWFSSHASKLNHHASEKKIAYHSINWVKKLTDRRRVTNKTRAKVSGMCYILATFYLVKNRQFSIINAALTQILRFNFISSPYYDWFITNHEIKSVAQCQKWSATVMSMHRIIVFNFLCGY